MRPGSAPTRGRSSSRGKKDHQGTTSINKMMPYKVVTKHTYSSKTKLGMSPFQYLRDKLDTSKSRKVGIAHNPDKKGGSGIGKDLNKENSTETRRTERTAVSEGTDRSGAAPVPKPTSSSGHKHSSQPASHLYHSSQQKVGNRPQSSSSASRVTISHNYSRAQYRMGVSNRTPSSQKRGHSRPSSASAGRSGGKGDGGNDGGGDRVVYSRPSSASAVRSSSRDSSGYKYTKASGNGGGHTNYYQQTYHQVQQGGYSSSGSAGGKGKEKEAKEKVTVTAAPPSSTRTRPQSAGAVTVSQRIAHRNFRTPEMIIQDSKRKAAASAQQVAQDSAAKDTDKENGGGENIVNGEVNKSNVKAEETTAAAVSAVSTAKEHAIVQKSAASNLTDLSHKFCSGAELQYLQNIMSSGNLKGRSTTEFYTIGKVVGVGSFAKVRLAWHKLTGQAIAIKTYEKSKMKDASHLRRVQQEIRVMEKLNHPRLIRLFETLESPKRIHLIMEFVSAGNLCSYVKRRRRLPEEEARKIFHQICVALDYMHEVEIIHRDVKLENVLLDKDGNSKLIDFGFSVFSKDKKALKVFCGTPSYMAPEIVRRIEYEGKPVDAWSLGVVLYALVCGCFPFSAKSYPDLYKKIMKGSFRVPDSLSHSLKDLIHNLLQMDPRKRYTVGQAKNHPWVHNGKGGKIGDRMNGWQCDPGCSEILISKNAKNDLNDSVIKAMDEFGVRRETIIHNVLHKTHNGINTCYYLLKQAMKDNGSLVVDVAAGGKTKGEKGEDGKTIISSAAYNSGASRAVRPLSAPTNKTFNNRFRGNGGAAGGSAAALAAALKKEDELDEEEDSFIKEDVDSASDEGGSGLVGGAERVGGGAGGAGRTGLTKKNS
ncbi:hypothetical protein TrST_g1702 [Triparma strigata]|uniref:Protein kinase domain-containing protein n=1 Tax=Triparma strigata TaxID=1606541 RepID=A0A9W7DR63_9STRA|nr:hypothetical protein TrST_g1702 [Triparma strigata]